MPPGLKTKQRRDDELQTWDATGTKLRLVRPAPIELEQEPSPLLEAIRGYLDSLA